MIGEKPYLYPIGYSRDRLTFWVVDGNWIRTNKDIEFTDWGQHYDKRYIPKGQIWIDYGADLAEQDYFAKSAAKEYRLMSNGMSYVRAEEIADETEHARRKSEKVGPGPIKIDLLMMIGVVEVWLVNGHAVRDKFDVDYTEGGHDRKYAWIPKDQIWLDNAVQENERPVILLHELFERNKMGEGWRYLKAHRAASAIELRCRRGRADVQVELDIQMQVVAIDTDREVTLYARPWTTIDKPLGTYPMAEAADMLGLGTGELLRELAQYGFIDIGGFHAEFTHTVSE